MAFSPLDIAWHTAFWAEGPNFVALGLTDGTAVSSWPDESGNGRSATQATATSQPLYRATGVGLNSKPAVDFDGTDDWLRTAAFAVELSQPNTLVVVAIRDTGTDPNFVDGLTDAKRNQLGVRSGSFEMYAGAVVNGPASDTIAHVFIAEYNGASSKFKVDGTETTGNAGAAPIDGITLGSHYSGGGTELLDGRIAFVGLYDGILTDDEKQNLTFWAEEHYGIATTETDYATKARLARQSVEVATQKASEARLARQSIEVALGPAPTASRLARQSVEAFTQKDSDARLGRQSVEAFTQADSDARLARQSIEVFTTEPPPQNYNETNLLVSATATVSATDLFDENVLVNASSSTSAIDAVSISENVILSATATISAIEGGADHVVVTAGSTVTAAGTMQAVESAAFTVTANVTATDTTPLIFKVKLGGVWREISQKTQIMGQWYG